MSRDDFSGLVVVISLLLSSCNIQAILENSFDLIGETLIELSLNGNHIKHVSIDLFYTFLDLPIIFSYNHKTFTIDTLAVPCNCDSILLSNTTLISFGYRLGNFDNCPIESCKDAQLIHAEKLQLEIFKYETSPLAYMNFQLNLNRNQKDSEPVLIVKQFKARPYRLWIMNLIVPDIRRRSQCPKIEWLRQSVDCLRFSRSEENIPIAKDLMKSNFTIVCIILLQHPRRVWPLHCITVSNINHNRNQLVSMVNLLLGFFNHFYFWLFSGIWTFSINSHAKEVSRNG